MTNLSKLIESVERNKTRRDALAKVNTNSAVRINNNYLNKALKNNKINKIIIGQDPYPSGATDIPFFKEDILETISFKNLNPTGSYVFLKLLEPETIDILFKNHTEVLKQYQNSLQKLKKKKNLVRNKKMIEDMKNNNTDHCDVAISFMEKGILFLNTRYWVIPRNFEACQTSENLNTYILDSIVKASKEKKINIICIGDEAKTYIEKWVENDYKNHNQDKLTLTFEKHPASTSKSVPT